MNELGKIWDKKRARQLILFDGMVLKNKCFTDIDSMMEYDNKAWLIFEVKHRKKDVPFGQLLALERFVKDTSKAGKFAVVAIVEHMEDSPLDDVILADCDVRKVYASKEQVWREPKRHMKARELAELFVDYVDRVTKRRV